MSGFRLREEGQKDCVFKERCFEDFLVSSLHWLRKLLESCNFLLLRCCFYMCFSSVFICYYQLFHGIDAFEIPSSSFLLRKLDSSLRMRDASLKAQLATKRIILVGAAQLLNGT